MVATKKLHRKKKAVVEVKKSDHTYFYNSGFKFTKESPAFKHVKEEVKKGTHTHVQQTHPWQVLCWNGTCHNTKDNNIKKGMAL